MPALITALMPAAIHWTARPVASAPVSAITSQCRKVVHSHRLQISRFILQVLREAAEPVATHDVVRRLMTECGQDTEDRRLVKLTMKRVGMAFSRQKALGTVRAIQGAGPVTLWEVVGEP